MNKWMVVINPWAGSGLGKTDWPAIKNILLQKGFDIKAVFTEHQYHAIDIVKNAVAEGFRNFIAVGGDGTLHEVINGAMFQSEVPAGELTIGCIPVGSGNDWIKMYGIPHDYEGAIDIIAAGNVRRQDLAKVTTSSATASPRYMINIGGALFDGNTIGEFTRLKLKYPEWSGKSKYILGLLKTFIKSKCRHVDITVDGQPYYSGKILSVAFGIGQYSGGGLIQTPGATPDDGLLDMTVYTGANKPRALMSMWRLLNGSIYKYRRIRHCQLRTVTITGKHPINVEVDGEEVGTTPLSIEMVPAAINVLVPASK